MVTAARAAAGPRDARAPDEIMSIHEEPAVAEHRFSTLCVSPITSTADGQPLVPAIVQSTSYCRDGIDSRAEHRYSRESNPTVAGLEIAVGRLERARAIAFASGLAAETALLLATVKTGDHVVCSRSVYGGTFRLLRDVFRDLGVAVSFVDTTNPPLVADSLCSRTKLVIVETPANPTLVLTDIAAIARLLAGSEALLAVDNTFLTPVLQQPLDLGADISIYSTTKFIDGHSLALGGALVTRNETLADRLWFLRKCTGGIQAPFQAWLTQNGLKTLPLRVRHQSRSAGSIAKWLASSQEVSIVNHPSLDSFSQRDLADRQHIGLHGAVVSFELRGGAARTRRFLAEIELCRLAEHVGSVESLLTHPATMTHGSIPASDRAAIGVSEELLRLSVGLEDPSDIIEDLERAIRRSAGSPCAKSEEVCA